MDETGKDIELADTPRVTIWNEYRHEKSDENVAEIYPDGIHGALAAVLKETGLEVRTATLDEPEQGLPPAVLDTTDVLLWWGHIGHAQVADEVVDGVHARVLAGMGLLVLHSGHYSKIFQRVTGSTASLLWRNDGERELVWTIDRTHPIAAGIPSPLVIPRQEMYGEPFDIPVPDELVFVSSFPGGEIFRSGRFAEAYGQYALHRARVLDAVYESARSSREVEVA